MTTIKSPFKIPLFPPLVKGDKNETAVGILIALAAFLIYVLTLAPTVTFIDSGELAAVTSILGIAHPTGYPLFTLVGWLFTKLPISESEIYKVNLMSAVFCSVGVFMFFKVLVFVLGQCARQDSRLGIKQAELNKKRDKGRGTGKTARPQQLDKLFVLSAAAFGTLALAFSDTYWSQAVAVEVYSLHCLLIISVMYLFLKAIVSTDTSGATIQNPEPIKHQLPKARPRVIRFLTRERYRLLFAFALGLSFSNHMTTILLAPAFLYLYFAVQGIGRDAFKKILLMVIPFLLGLSFYLYLPIRASQNPPLNWGNPTTLERFLWHFSGKQYRVWIFESTEAAAKQFKYFLGALPKEFAYFPLLFATLGLRKLFREQRRLFYFTLLLFVGCVAYAINYDIHDIDAYFLLSYITVALWTGLGVNQVFPWLKTPDVRNLIAGLLILSALVVLISNYREADESENYLVEDYTMNILDSIQPNGILLSFQWDYFVSSSLYFQFVKNVRRDVVVIDKELLRRSWYFNQLRTNYPWLVEKSQSEINAFLKELYKFEHDLPYDASVIQARYIEMINSFIDKNIEIRPVYVTFEIEQEIGSKYQRVPEGLAFRLYKDREYHEMKPFDFKFRDIRKTNRLIRAIKQMYPMMLTNRGIYTAQHGRLAEAATYFDKALAFDPNFTEAKRWKEQLRLP